MTIRNNKRGGFTCFLAIILTSVTVLMTVLSKASSIRYEEALLTGLLIQQQDLVLSGYSEKLLDWYGIYATSLQNRQEESFDIAVSGIDRLTSYSCTGTDLLDTDDHLKEAILAFSRPRVPLQLSLQLLSRFTKMSSIIDSNKQSSIIDSNKQSSVNENVVKKTPGSSYIPENKKEETPMDYEAIIELLGLIDKSALDKNTDQETTGSFSWEELNEMLKTDKSSPVVEMDLSKQMKSSLTVTESNLCDMSIFLEQFYRIESNSFYDRLCFEFYVSSMFSCKTNARIQDGIEIERKDLRNRTISVLPVKNKLEIEKIIFGCQKEETNDFFAKISIESVRFLIHLITNATNGAKKAEITATALVLCSAAALATGGTVVIPQNVMEVVVLLLISMNSAIQEYSTLSKGQSVPLLPVSSSTNIDTFYTDYLQIFLFAVPESVKLNRMAAIIRENLSLTGTSLYTGVSVSLMYRDIIYKVKGRYDDNEIGQENE